MPVLPDPIVVDGDALFDDALPSPGPPPFAFSRLDDNERADLPPESDFVPLAADEDEVPQFEIKLHHPERAGRPTSARAGGHGGAGPSAAPAIATTMLVDELRQYKTLCDRLLPGLRTQSHLYTLIHLDDRTHTVTLSEWGEVIGGTTFRLVQAANAPCLILEVLLLAVEQRAGVCGRGHGTRLVNYLKVVALRIAHRRGLAAAIVAQSDWQSGPGGGAARQFWVRQRLRATPQAMMLTRALFQWDRTNEVYAHAVPMLCWLASSDALNACDARDSTRAQQHAAVRTERDAYRHTRHTRRVTVKMRGALTLLPPIEPEPPPGHEAAATKVTHQLTERMRADLKWAMRRLLGGLPSALTSLKGEQSVSQTGVPLCAFDNVDEPTAVLLGEWIETELDLGYME